MGDFTELTKEEEGLCKTNPTEAVEKHLERTEDPLILSKEAVKNNTGMPYEKSKETPSVTQDEKEIGIDDRAEAIKLYGRRTGISPGESFKIITSEIDDYKSELMEKANLFKGGDSTLEHDETDFWLWKHRNIAFSFVFEDADKNISCMDANDLWRMDQAKSRDITFIDVLAKIDCLRCQYSDKCSQQN